MSAAVPLGLAVAGCTRSGGVLTRPPEPVVLAGGALPKLLGSDPADDIDDPLGQPIDRWRAMSAELDTAISTVLAGLFPKR